MVRNTFFGYGQPAVSLISPENKLFADPNLTPYEYDLARAKALLEEGGYVDRDGDGVREDAHGNPLVVRSVDERRQPGARAAVLDPPGGLGEARHPGELPPPRVLDAGREALVELRLGRDGDGIHRRRRAAQFREPAALLRQPAPLATRISRSPRPNGRRRSIASSTSAPASSISRRGSGTTGGSRRSFIASCR